MGVLYI